MICSRTEEPSGLIRRSVGWSLVAALVLAACANAAGKGRTFEREDLINVLLSPSLAQWLIGPVSRIASDEEIRSYLAVTDDEDAEAFIAAFWQRRADPRSPWPGRQPKDVFDARAEKADRMFSEGTHLGRRTDRGVTYILFGPPEGRGYLQEDGRRKRTIEIWTYPDSAEPGLDGAKPKRQYFFARKDGVTVYTARPKQRFSIIPIRERER